MLPRNKFFHFSGKRFENFVMSVLCMLRRYKSKILQSQIEVQERRLYIFLNYSYPSFSASFKLGTTNGGLFINSKR